MMRDEIVHLLSDHGVTTTPQRLDVAEVLYETPQHVSADQIIERLKSSGKTVSKATVYNTLNMFVDKDLVREVHVDPERTYYDSTTTPHHHFFNVDTHELIDVPMNQVIIENLPELPPGTIAESVDVVIKVRDKT